MSANRRELESRLEEYEQRLGGLESYLKELKARVDEHGTETAHVEEDMVEAEHNLDYYADEIARIKGELGGGGSSIGGVLGGALPQTLTQGVGTLVLAALCFTAGALIGSRLLSGRGDD